MESRTAGIIIAAAIAILVGVVLLGVIGDQTNENTSLTALSTSMDISPARLAKGAINETYYFTPSYLASNGWRMDNVGECSVDDLVLKNASGYVLDNNGCGAGGDYVYVTDVNIHLCNSVPLNGTVGAGSNSTSLSYSYCADGYVAGWAGTVQDLVPGFFALAILLGTVFLIFLVLKGTGLV